MPILPFSPARILVLHTDGVTVNGAVFGRSMGRPEMVAQVTAKAPDPNVAVAEILGGLKANGTPAPKQAVIVTDRAVLVRADLPVHPDRPRPYEQMRELARWEADAGFSDLPDWEMSAILRSIGAVSDGMDARIRQEIADHEISGARGAVPRYQDVALSRNVIDRATRDAAIDIRERLSQPTGESGCGWVPIHRDASIEQVQHAWLLSAIGEFDRDTWREACRSNKLTLKGILPSWGLTEATAPDVLDGEQPDAQRLILERHNAAISLVHLNGKAVESIRLINLARTEADEMSALKRVLEGRQQSQMLATGFDPEAQELINGIYPNALHQPDTLKAIMTGAAAHGLEVKGRPGWPAVIAPEEPRPPIWKSSNFYRVAMVGIIVLAIGAVDLRTRYQKASLTGALTEKQQLLEQRTGLANVLRQSVRRVDQLEQEVEQAKLTIAELETNLKNAEYLQVKRQNIVEGMLVAIIKSIPKGVVMREISEARGVQEVFTLSAWSINDIAAERFIKQLNENLVPLGLEVADETVFQQNGPNNYPGYGTRLRLAPSVEPTGRRAEVSQ